MTDLYQTDATTTKKGIVKLATNTDVTAGLAVQANDTRLMPTLLEPPRIEGEIYPMRNNATIGFLTSSGILSNLVTMAGNIISFNIGIDATHGVYAFHQASDYASNATDGIGLAYNMLQRRYNIKMILKFQLAHTTNVKYFIGFSDMTSDGGLVFPAIGNDGLNAKNGYGIYVTSGGNFRVARNDGAGATVFTSDIEAIDTDAHTVYFETDEANARFGYSWDGGAMVWHTTEIPASTTPFGWTQIVENVNAEFRELRTYWGRIRGIRV